MSNIYKYIRSTKVYRKSSAVAPRFMPAELHPRHALQPLHGKDFVADAPRRASIESPTAPGIGACLQFIGCVEPTYSEWDHCCSRGIALPANGSSTLAPVNVRPENVASKTTRRRASVRSRKWGLLALLASASRVLKHVISDA